MFVSVKKYVKELPDALIISFEAFDEESQRKLYNYIMNANDLAHFTDAVMKRDKLLFRIENYAINFNENEVCFMLKPANVYTEISEELIEALKMTRDANVYVFAQISDVAKSRRGKTKIYIDNVNFIVADYDEDRAKEYLNEHDPITAICHSLGYHPELEIVAITIPRIIPLFKPFARGVHVIQFTPPETGKTTTAQMLSQLDNVYHCLSFPSRAKLIGDARFNSYGICYKYDVVIVEEFDKIAGKRVDEFKEDYEALLTGLEQGIWQREKSSRADISYVNHVSFLLFGNVDNTKLDDYTLNTYNDNSRERVKAVIESLTGINAEPFMSRFTYVEFLTKPVNAMRYVILNDEKQPMYLHPAISRAIIKILKDRVVKNAKKFRKESSRMDRHFNTLKTILKTLEIDLDDATIEALVKGDKKFIDVIKQNGSDDVGEASDELSEEDVDKILEGDEI